MEQHLLKGPFTVEAYQRLAELGVLNEDDRVELIDGQVVEMSPIREPHASCVRRLTDLFARNCLHIAMIDVQNPVVLGEHDAPQPDLTLLRRRSEGYPGHPRASDMLLVVEVADTSLSYDRGIKMPLYARMGIPEAWLVDLQADRIAVYREPTGGQYASVRLLSRGETLSPLPVPDVTLSTDDILG
jgi:Uma2 family endonuclease